MNKRISVLLRALTIKPDAALACALLLMSEESGISPQKLFKSKVDEVVGLRPLVKPISPELEKKLETLGGYVASNYETMKKLFLAASQKQTHPLADEIQKLLLAAIKTRAMIEALVGDILIDMVTLNELDRVYTVAEQALSKTTDMLDEPVALKLTRKEIEALKRLLTRFALNR